MTEVWRNWAGNQSARPAQVVAPGSVEELSAAVVAAGEAGLPVKAVGAGHSFTAIAAAGDAVLVRPDRLTAVRKLDREAGTVTVESGLPLHRLNRLLAAAGLSLTNMGDIEVQTVAGATSTGTHGTGRDSGSLAAQIEEVEIVLADGSVRTCSATEDAELFQGARLGLGALGVVSALTFAVEPMFLLSAHEKPMGFDEVLDSFDDLTAVNEHFEFYWFPHTDRCSTKRNNRSQGPAEPLPRFKAWLDDDFVSNTVWEGACRVGRAFPGAIPTIAQIASRAWSERRFTDQAYKVYTSPRKVRFIEMEYAVPREAATGVLRELRALVERSDWRISFPVEVRVAPADDLWLSTANGRDSVYIAVHLYRGTRELSYFTEVEKLMAAHRGRPHWGKLHTRDAEYLASVYPHFGDFTALRDKVDPERRFANAYLRRVLGA
ncbi:D-arabinono-1,4-lactone oxidase [Kitasatospora cineracea]|uniref:D-arabinono-1,4-lactone oxidase n=1 Tax=Kitasatospora TaxID=2063 RepID=UPI0004C2C9E8|nr:MULTISPECIES: D-arabinono-1,4-lactone oxidase [unclassified Kitasatospora]WAL74177.1 FAD-binding protein [Kitasatospora sp. YST-16]WNW40244.1 D-arabinono-1,4-lactone oxidase [Streptomyces sp. Li-HN-5-13]